MQSGVHREYS